MPKKTYLGAVLPNVCKKTAASGFTGACLVLIALSAYYLISGRALSAQRLLQNLNIPCGSEYFARKKCMICRFFTLFSLNFKNWIMRIPKNTILIISYNQLFIFSRENREKNTKFV